MQRLRSFVFRGKRYRIVWREPPKRLNAYGTCDHPATKGKTIYISPKLDGEHLTRVVIDEALHACIWDIDNDSVDETATSIAKFLHKLGLIGDNHAS